MALVCRDARLVRPLKKPLLAPKSPPPIPPKGGVEGLRRLPNNITYVILCRKVMSVTAKRTMRRASVTHNNKIFLRHTDVSFLLPIPFFL